MVLCKAYGKSRARSEQGQCPHGVTQCDEVLVLNGIDHGYFNATGCKFADPCLNGGRSAQHHRLINEAHLSGGLGLQHANQVGVGHGCEGMVLHSTLIEQPVIDEEMALVDGAAVVGECRCGHREPCLQGIHEGIRDRANIALGCAVEGGAVFEVDLIRALRTKPGKRLERLLACIISRDVANLQGHYHRIDFLLKGRRWKAVDLNDPKACLD